MEIALAAIFFFFFFEGWGVSFVCNVAGGFWVASSFIHFGVTIYVDSLGPLEPSLS